MKKRIRFKNKYHQIIWTIVIFTFVLVCLESLMHHFIINTKQVNQEFIKWVDYDVTQNCMKEACKIDIESYEQQVHCDWVQLLAYAAAKTGGSFSKEKQSLQYIEEARKKLVEEHESIESWRKEIKYFNYYEEVYQAVLGGFLGTFEIEGNKQYGLKAFSPIAKGFPFQHYDDFGVSRSYGYKRQHLGHDMMGQIGTPVIAIESGTVEALGWNQYGGWRIGIRSYDHKRYYYYAHLRQNRPYAEGLEEGKKVVAGDVIGYLGHTGYSTTENVNNIQTPHLHVGIELIFDESQKDSNNEIWINCYEIVKFLQANQSQVIRNDKTKEWSREYKMTEYEDDKTTKKEEKESKENKLKE